MRLKHSFSPALVLGVLLLFSAPANAQSLAEFVDKAAKVETVRIDATGQRFEPQQTIGPNAPARHASNYQLTTHWAPAEEQATEAWKLRTIYPFPNNLTFEASYHANGGTRSGRDGFRPSADGPVSPARLGAVMKDLWLTNPLLLMARASGDVSAFETGAAYTFNAMDTQWTVTINPETGLPETLETIERDHLETTRVNSVSFKDWRMIDGVPFSFRIEQRIGGRLIRREVRNEVSINNAFERPVPSPASEENFDQARKDLGWSMSHFFLRRAMLGAPSDGDEAASVQINNLGRGIYQVTGSSHHTIIVEGRKGLAIVDAAWYPRRSEAVLAAIRKKWRRKRIKYLILTHHHIDHTGGLLPLAELDLTLVTSAANFTYFYDILNEQLDEVPRMRPVDGRLSLTGIGRELDLFDVPNSHADDMIGIYVEDAKTVINTDLYSPGRPTQQMVWASELADAIKFHDLDVEQHVGTHGLGLEPHENLLQLRAAQ